MWKFGSQPSHRSIIDDIRVSRECCLRIFTLFIIPFANPKSLGISIESSNEEFEDLIRIGFGGNHYDQDLYDTIAEFVRECAYDLCAVGKCYRHVRIVENPQELSRRFRSINSEKIFRVERLRSDLIRKRFLKLYQLVS